MDVKTLKNLLMDLPEDYKINIANFQLIEFIEFEDGNPRVLNTYAPIVEVVLNDEEKVLSLRTEIAKFK